MINLRYHIVSITAVFLALGIGVALGGTFLESPTVGLLNRNIRNAEAKIDASNAENARLRAIDSAASERDDAILELDKARMLSSYAEGVPVVVIVPPGVKGDLSNGVRTTVTDSGADFRGTLVLTDKMKFDGDLDETLAEQLGVDATTSADLGAHVFTNLRAVFQRAGSTATEGDGAGVPDQAGTTTPDTTVPGDPVTTTVASDTTTSTLPGQPEATIDPASPTTTTTVPAPPNSEAKTREFLTALLDGDYLDFEPADGSDAELLVGSGHRFVMVTSNLVTPEQRTVARRLLPLDEPLPVVTVSETTDFETDAKTPVPLGIVELIREDEKLASAYNTVDGIEHASGLLSTILVLDELGRTAPGQYGQGPGATAILPGNS